MIYLAPVDWGTIRQRPQQLATRLAERCALKYVNAVGLRSIRLSDTARVLSRAAGSREESPAFPVINPRYVPLLGAKTLDSFNRRWLFDQLQPLLPDGQKPWTLWIGAPNLLAEALLERARPSLVVYDCMDRYAAFHSGRIQARIERAEQAIVERADLTFATSQALVERLQKFTSVVHLAPNGVEVERFAVGRANQPPAWRQRLQGPVIGYHGTVGEWLDFHLLEWLADRRPEWSFVVVGPNATRRSRGFFSRPNVHYVGPVPYAELPAHTAWFDVGLVPFELNEVTQYVHPIKALEYLAAGLPTVSTPLADLAELSQSIRFADVPYKWLAAIEDSLEPEERTPLRVQQRRDSVAHRTWDKAAERIAFYLDAGMTQGPRRHAPASAPSLADTRKAA